MSESKIIAERERTIAYAKMRCEPSNKYALAALLKLIKKEGDKDAGVAHGLPYRLQRNTFGAWCGYVGVFHDHPAYKKGYDDVDVRVHGGLTFSGENHEWGHGELWWLGFDTAHSGDLTLLTIPIQSFGFREIYRTKAYVKAECESLAKQLVEMDSDGNLRRLVHGQ